MLLPSYVAVLTMHGETWKHTLSILERFVTLWEIANGSESLDVEDIFWDRQVQGIKEWCLGRRDLPPMTRKTVTTPIPVALFLSEEERVCAALLFPTNGDGIWEWVIKEPLDGWTERTVRGIHRIAERVWERIWGRVKRYLPLMAQNKVWCYCDWLSGLNAEEKKALFIAVQEQLLWLQKEGLIVKINGIKGIS